VRGSEEEVGVSRSPLAVLIALDASRSWSYFPILLIESLPVLSDISTIVPSDLRDVGFLSWYNFMSSFLHLDHLNNVGRLFSGMINALCMASSFNFQLVLSRVEHSML